MNRKRLVEIWSQMLFTLVEKERLVPKTGWSRKTPEEFADAVQECLWRWRNGTGSRDYLGHALVNLLELIALVEGAGRR